MLVASHIIDDVLGMFTRVIVLERGRMVYDGGTEALSSSRAGLPLA